MKSPWYQLLFNQPLQSRSEIGVFYSRGASISMQGLLVFFHGVLQIIGGAWFTVFTFSTFAQVGMGLIPEGTSDCIHGIESMVTGEFSRKSWAKEKVISIGVSLIRFGVGKLIAMGFKASKMLIKGFCKELKMMPKFLFKEA